MKTVVTLVALIGVAACGGPDDDTGGGQTTGAAKVATPVPQASLLDALVLAVCDRQARCGCADERTDCEAKVRAQFEPMIGSLATTHGRYDAACAGASLDALTSTSCSVRVERVTPDQSACDDTCRIFDIDFDGALACKLGCERGSICQFGACEACPTREGDVCAGYCGGGLMCDVSSRRCRPPPAVGQTCSLGGVCAKGSSCAAGQCVAKLSLGKACSASAQCDSGYCPRGACDTLPLEGEPCPAGRCGDGYRCDDSLPPTMSPPPEPRRCIEDKVTSCALPYTF